MRHLGAFLVAMALMGAYPPPGPLPERASEARAECRKPGGEPVQIQIPPLERRNLYRNRLPSPPRGGVGGGERGSAECRRASGPIKPDGVLDEPTWKSAPVISEFVSGGRPARTKTSVRFLWDDTYLYFAAEMEDHDLYADITTRNGRIWTNDVIELFLKPSEQRLGYYEFQSNAANTLLELYFPSRGAGGYQRFAPISRLGLEIAVKRDGTLNHWEDDDKGWTAEWRIPWTAFKTAGGRPKPGDVWRFAACRYDYSKDFENPELSSTSDPGFHTYESYAELKFIGPDK